MIYFLALVPATGLTIAGYLVLYLAHRSEGGLRAFGKYLGFWAFTLAGLVVLGAIFAAAHGNRHGDKMDEHGMYGHMHGGWPGDPRMFGPRGDERCNGPAGSEPDGAPHPGTLPAPSPPATH